MFCGRGRGVGQSSCQIGRKWGIVTHSMSFRSTVVEYIGVENRLSARDKRKVPETFSWSKHET